MKKAEERRALAVEIGEQKGTNSTEDEEDLFYLASEDGCSATASGLEKRYAFHVLSCEGQSSASLQSLPLLLLCSLTSFLLCTLCRLWTDTALALPFTAPSPATSPHIGARTFSSDGQTEMVSRTNKKLTH